MTGAWICLPGWGRRGAWDLNVPTCGGSAREAEVLRGYGRRHNAAKQPSEEISLEMLQHVAGPSHKLTWDLYSTLGAQTLSPVFSAFHIVKLRLTSRVDKGAQTHCTTGISGLCYVVLVRA